MKALSRSIIVLLGLSILPSPTSGYKIREGMTQEAVASKLGQPIHRRKPPDGGETWTYTAIKKERHRALTQNYERPGESVYERDLRIDTTGGVASTFEFSTTESYEEQPIHFDPNGRLVSSPPHRFLPRP
jgi:outer membrane protein assembly factor BamE (lipoprotein component of BamABCDE complex)